MAAASRNIAAFSAILQMDHRGRTLHQCLQVKAQGFRDEGRSRKHIEDANMRLMRERMEVIRIKESLERCLVVVHDHDHHHHHLAGWNSGYAPEVMGHYKDQKIKRNQSHILELLMVVCWNFGVTVASGTLCLCLASILVHLNQ